MTARYKTGEKTNYGEDSTIGFEIAKIIMKFKQNVNHRNDNLMNEPLCEQLQTVAIFIRLILIKKLTRNHMLKC